MRQQPNKTFHEWDLYGLSHYLHSKLLKSKELNKDNKTSAKNITYLNMLNKPLAFFFLNYHVSKFVENFSVLFAILSSMCELLLKLLQSLKYGCE